MQWIQNPKPINFDNLNNIRRCASRHFRNIQKEDLKDKIEDAKTNIKKKYTRDLYSDINDFKKASQPGNNIVKVRRVISLQTPTAICLFGGTNS